MAELEQSTFDSTTERALRARILELEALVEARTQAIVGLGAQLAEARGDGSPVMADRLREAERQLAELRGTKVMRYTASPVGRTRCCGAPVAEQDSEHAYLTALEAQLEQSRQQQTRLKDVLTRLLSVLEVEGTG